MKYRFVYFSITVMWILITAVVSFLVYQQSIKQSYPQFQTCKSLLKKYPGGIAADWAPTIGPQTVLNTTNQKTWKPLQVSWVGNDLYNRQHLWFDVDGDGIMCETDQSAPRKK